MGLTQTDFAKAIEISVLTLRNWEKERVRPEVRAIALLRIAVRHHRVIGETGAFGHDSAHKLHRADFTLHSTSRLHDTPTMAKHLTIGELAEEAGVPTSTVRYYERAKLLKPSARSPSNYRLYSPSDLERLRFIRAAQATGFTLDDVTKLLRPAPCGSVQHLIEDRLEGISERMKELRHVQQVLRAALAECLGHASTGRCKVVDDLSARAKRPR